MKYRRLGSTGIKVSELSLGTNNFGTEVDQQTSARIMKKAVDVGINMIDTANVYAQGRSEELIGKAIWDDRDELLIATKVGINRIQPHYGGLSRKHIMWQVRKSLERLQTDYIDFYCLHVYDLETPLEETLRTMDYLVKQGRVRYVACSNFTIAQLEEAREICERLDLEKFVTVQPPYNLLLRGIEMDLLPYCQEKGLGVLTYSPLAGGLLTGKYKQGEPPPKGSRAALNRGFWEETKKQTDFSALARLLAIANDSKLPLRNLSLAWVMRKPTVTALIAGASNPEQVEENYLALEAKVPEDVLRMLDEAHS